MLELKVNEKMINVLIFSKRMLSQFYTLAQNIMSTQIMVFLYINSNDDIYTITIHQCGIKNSAMNFQISFSTLF